MCWSTQGKVRRYGFSVITTQTEMGFSDVAEVLNHPCFCKKLRKPSKFIDSTNWTWVELFLALFLAALAGMDVNLFLSSQVK